MKRRTLLDAFMDLAIRFVDAVDAKKLLTDREKKALQAKIIDTTAKEVISASEPDSDTTNEP